MDCFRLRSLSYGGQVARCAPRNDARKPQLASFLKPAEHRGQVGAEDIGEITALLHQHGRQSDLRDRLADATKTVGRHRKARQRIVLGRIEAEGHNERTRRKGTDGLFGGAERPDIIIVPSAFRQGNVETGAEPRGPHRAHAHSPKRRD